MVTKIIFRFACLSVVAVNLTACAPILSGAMNATVDESTLKTKTADYLGVSSESVSISAMDKAALSTSYKAQYGDKRFSCTIYYGQVNCRQLESAIAPAKNDIAVARPTNQLPQMTSLEAQTRLNQLGFPVGTPDGVFGKKSIQQLNLFQASRGLPETGKLDAQTIEALR